MHYMMRHGMHGMCMGCQASRSCMVYDTWYYAWYYAWYDARHPEAAWYNAWYDGMAGIQKLLMHGVLHGIMYGIMAGIQKLLIPCMLMLMNKAS